MSNWDVMSPPVPPDGKAFLRLNPKDGKRWVYCGWCEQKLFPVDDDTEIRRLRMMCRGSRCKRITEIDV